MISERRRVRRRGPEAWLHALRRLPERAEDLVPRLPRHGRRRRRLLLAAGALVVVVAAAAAVVLVLRARGGGNVLWRLHDEAVAHFRAGRYAESAETCRQILERNPHDAVARFNYGASLLRLGREAEGWEAVAEAAARDPDFDDAHAALAERWLRDGKEDRALEELRRVVAQPPAAAPQRVLLSEILRRRGAWAEAMEQLRAVLADDGATPLLRVESGAELGRLHGLRAAFSATPAHERRQEVECYTTARQLADAALDRPDAGADPRKARLRAARAHVLLALGREREALADADLALTEAGDPAERAALRMLRAQLYWAAGDAQAAGTEFEAALAGKAKPPPEAFTTAAAFHLSRGLADRALDVLARAAGLYPADVEIGAEHARLLFLAGRPDDADQECARLAEADARAIRPLLVRGDLRRARDDLAAARRFYEEALARAPGDVEARLRLAGTAFDESGVRSSDAGDRLAEAEGLAKQVLAERPGDPGALLALAKVRLAQAGPDAPEAAAEAHALLTRSVEGDPLSVEAHAFLAYANLVRGRPDEAVLGFERVLATVPDDRPRLRMLLANAYLRTGAADRAAEQARRVLDALGEDPGALGVLVDALVAQRDLDGALDALRRLEAAQPEHVGHLLRQAFVLAEKGDVAGAEERFAAAASRAERLADPDRALEAQGHVAEAKAEFYRRMGDVARAKGVYGAAIDRNPASADARIRYGRFLMALGQGEDAERQFQQAIALAPAGADARRALCELWFGRGQVTPALANQVQEVARIAPADPVVDYLRGKLAVLQGDLQTATMLLARYVGKRPDDPDGRYSLGVALGRAGQYAAALQHLQKAAELLPASPDVRIALAKTRYGWAMDLLRRGRYLEAQAALRNAVSEDPRASEPRAVLAEALRLTGDLDASEREVRGLLRASPSDTTALRILASIQAARGRRDDAERTLETAVGLDAKDWPAWAFLSSLRADRGDLDGADAAAQAARNAAPHEPMALAPLLHVLVSRNDFDAAARTIEAARASRPQEAGYAYLMAVLRAQQGRHEDVVAEASRALDLRPAMAGALQLAVASLRNGLAAPDRALAFARERAARAPENADMACQLAWLLAQHGDRDEALAVLRPHASAGLPYLPAVSHAAALLMDRGDHPAAREILRQGLDANPEAAELRFLLAQAYLADAASVKAGEPQEPARGLAIAELRSAVSLNPGYAAAQNNLAFLLARDEATRGEAVALSEAAVKARPRNAAYLDTLGTVFLRMGRAPQALETLRRALGVLEEERAALDRQAAEPLGRAEPHRIEALRRRHERIAAEVRAHYDEALRASGAR